MTIAVKIKHILTPVLLLSFSWGAYSQVNRDVPPAPAEAPIAQMPSPRTITADNGLKIIVFEDKKLPIVSFYLGLIDTKALEMDKSGIGEITAMMMATGTQTMTKGQILDLLSDSGSNFHMTKNSIYVSGLKRYAAPNFDLLSKIVLTPSFPHNEFSQVISRTRSYYQDPSKNAQSVLDNVYRRLAFGPNHPFGETTTPRTIDNISLSDCVRYYNTYWRPNNAVLLVFGDIKESDVMFLVNTRLRSWKKGTVPQEHIPIPNDLPKTQINFIHDPAARQANVVISNLAEFDYKSRDVYAAMLINYILGGDLLEHMKTILNMGSAGQSTLNKERFLLTPDKNTGYMFYSSAVPVERIDTFLVEKTEAFKKLRTKKIPDEMLQRIKRSLMGRFALSMENLPLLGAYMLATESDILRPDFQNTLLREISNVTSDDVMRVAQKYIKPDQFRILVSGDARLLVPPIEFAGYDVVFYDRNASLASRPSLARPVPEGKTPFSVWADYMQSMGGMRRLKNITSLRQVFDISFGDKVFEGVYMASNPHQEQFLLMQNKKVYLKRTYNGNMGYTKIGNTRKDMPMDKVDRKRLVRVIFPQVSFSDEGYTMELDSIVPVHGYFAYKLQVTMPSREIKNYYVSMDDGMLLRAEDVATKEIRKQNEDGSVEYTPEVITSRSDFFDYKQAAGVPFPMRIESDDQGGVMRWMMKENEINPKFRSRDFR